MSQTAKPPGRPRDAATDKAIAKATLDLLAEVGLHGVTLEAIAARAGISRPTLYRRFPNREAIVIAALLGAVRPLRDPNLGSTRADLFAMLSALVDDLDERVGASVLGVHAALRSDPVLARPFRKQYLAPRAMVISAVLARGMERGELRSDLPADVLRDLIFGPAIYRLLITGKPMNERELDTTFEATWCAIAAPR
jgi:AcrR family transcriptional regulator